jgi:AraC-like DNA-binding protein/uncharacterized cupin superfamily protein
MFSSFDKFALSGQHQIKTWQQQSCSWASYSLYCNQASHELYIPQTILNLVITGQKRMYDGREVLEVQTGDALVIPAGTLVCSEILRPSGQYCSINLVIPDQLILDMLKKPRRPAAPSKSIMKLPASSDRQRFSSFLLQHFTDEALSVPDYYNTIDRALQLLDSYEDASNMLTRSARLPLPEVMEKLSKTLTEVQFLEEMAAMGHMSTATLKRRFRDLYHSSPMQWIMDKRLQVAGYLLRTTSKPIQEIAYETGFEDIPHFYRQFRRCFGATPLQWRKL